METRRVAASFDPSFVSITAAGFAATVAQVLLLRELLLLFYGNEMSTALALAGWLLWTSLGSALAARLSSRLAPSRDTLGLLLALLAAALPGLVLLVRGSRWVYGIPSGELPTIGKMLLVCLSAPVLFCPVAGALFGLCWAHRRSRRTDGSDTRPLAVYLGEAVGAAGGGLFFYFVLLRFAPAFTASVVVALLLLAVAGWMLRPRRFDAITRPSAVVWWLTVTGTLTIAVLGGRLDWATRKWQWGEQLVAARDTPYHNIAILQQPGQTTVFTNGLWLFTLPDPATIELAVHVALLEHGHPERLLLLGGGLAGHAKEALKHPSIGRIDYVELDPELISFSEDYLSAGVRASLRDNRVRIHQEDAGTFLRRWSESYDVILMNVGDPINAQMNRFFTVEQFRRIAERLRAGGILSLSVPGGGDMVGPAHARFLGSMNRTLQEVFPEVIALPGERARWLAASATGTLILEPTILVARIAERKLDLAHVREDTLQDLMNPFRLDYLTSLLAGLEDSPINRQLAPICYFHVLMLWAAQWHPLLERLLVGAAGIEPRSLALGVALAGLLLVGFFWIGRPRYGAAVGTSVLVQGASEMVIQIVLILTFQILEGFAYLELALIIAGFMAGLAAGTLWIAALRERWRDRTRAIRGFALAQVGVTVFPLVLLFLLLPATATLREALSPLAASWSFCAASFATGVLGGAHFALAALASTATGARLERTGGYLYALDLVGAAGGALAAGLLLLPLYGVASALVLLSALSLACLLAILRRDRQMPGTA